jgi:hypothetical protein
MFKHIAGVGNVKMTPEEEAATRAEWAANDPKKQPAKPEPSSAEKLAAFINANPDVRAMIDG